MITAAVEQTAQALLVALLGVAPASVGKPLPDGVPTIVFDSPLGLDNTLSDGGIGGVADDNGIVLAGPVTLFLYRGGANEEIQLPCIICSAESAEGEIDSGNSKCKLTNEVRYPGDGSEMPPKIAAAIDAVMAKFLTDSICTDLNAVRVDPDAITFIGVVDFSESQSPEGRQLTKSSSVTFYCAGCNLT